MFTMMVENDFIKHYGKKFFFVVVAKVTPKRVWFRTKNAQNFQKRFLDQVPNRKILSHEISASHDNF